MALLELSSSLKGPVTAGSIILREGIDVRNGSLGDTAIVSGGRQGRYVLKNCPKLSQYGAFVILCK